MSDVIAAVVVHRHFSTLLLAYSPLYSIGRVPEHLNPNGDLMICPTSLNHEGKECRLSPPLKPLLSPLLCPQNLNVIFKNVRKESETFLLFKHSLRPRRTPVQYHSPV